MANDFVVGVILAAGKGSRMQPFSTQFPKPLLPICNRELIRYQIEHMVRLGIHRVIIVIGHLGNQISHLLGNGDDYGIEIDYVEQTKILGIAHAVGQLERYITSPFLLFLGDIFFETSDLSAMFNEMKQRNAAAVLAVKEEPDYEAIRRNFAVVLHHDGLVTRVIEKPRYVRSHLKGCGLYLFDLPFFDAVRRTPRTAIRDEYEITDSIQILIDDGYPVAVSRVIREDINVSYPADVLRCNMIQLQALGVSSIIAESVRIHPEASIEQSVIGPGVTISKPIRVSNSVIFPSTQVNSADDLKGVIATPYDMIYC